MKNLLTIAGLGPGSPELVTLEALNAAKDSDLIIVPRSHDNSQGVAEKIILTHLPEREADIIKILFPMIHDVNKRDEIILTQLINIKARLDESHKIFFPVIGDSMLYSTGAYLLDSLRKIYSDIECKFIPGVSAHSLAASCAKRFLAMSDEILTIIPGTSDPVKIQRALELADRAAIYKPSSCKNLADIIHSSGSFTKISRVDFAGIPELERIYEDDNALENINNYLSIILLWK